MSTSIRPEEIEHFAKDSSRWWDESGPFAVLHRLNPVRMRYITGQIGRKPNGLKILDIGCGGGLVCEPLARLGAIVTGIDADGQAIGVAREHAAVQDLDVNYICGAVENQKGKYDIVTALEIVEHVADMKRFVEGAAKLCKPGGLMIFSTLNRTPKSFALGIVAAEYILRWVPRGTHRWKQFIRPGELAAALRACGCEVADIRGYGFNPLSGDFELFDNDVSVNYFLTARKA